MSKTKQNIPKSKRGGYDFWSRRPLSGHSPLGAWAKRLCCRIERRMKKQFIQSDLKAEGLI